MTGRDEEAGHAEIAGRWPILTHFRRRHLPDRLQDVSAPFGNIAHQMAGYFHAADNPPPAVAAEVAAGLRKLLEAKDCFVRAAAELERMAGDAS